MYVYIYTFMYVCLQHANSAVLSLQIHQEEMYIYTFILHLHIYFASTYLFCIYTFMDRCLQNANGGATGWLQ